MGRWKYALWFVAAMVVAVVGAWSALPLLNSFDRQGSVVLSGLGEPVKVMRDEKGMAYLYARDFEDAVMAQGFITAQDRLFQMHLTRLVAQGRISELAGEVGKPLDIRMRTIGIHRNAKKHAQMLDESNRLFMQRYADGVNQYMKTMSKELPLEFKLSGLSPEPWSIADSLCVVYFMGWMTSANVRTEVLTQMLVEKLGPDMARELFPVNRNPDEPGYVEDTGKLSRIDDVEPLHFAQDRDLLGYLSDVPSGQGSNNWAVSPGLSPSAKPIVANDPHLDSRIMPGVWYPIGLITPQARAVGVIIPGIPGMVIGRTDRIAMGVTNAYGDCQDLYVETVDPSDSSKYLEGDVSVPFQVIGETLKIKDKAAPGGFREEKVEIRLTRRGPIVSGVMPGLRTQKAITLRWAAAEAMTPKLGLRELLAARSAAELRDGLRHLTFIVLNCVFADTDGNIGWHVSGKLPIRSEGASTVPVQVKSSRDNWIGWIPFEKMPNSLNPPRGWVGTCNHRTVSKDYPYYYSSYAAPSYRYQRLKELLDGRKQVPVEDHWQFQRDITNPMAREVAPVMARSLIANEDTRGLGKILESWDHRDDPDRPGATVFQLVYRNFVRLALQERLGHDLTDAVMEEGYFWQERLQKMMLEGSSRWFDGVSKPGGSQTPDELFRRAAGDALNQHGPSLGSDPAKWLWGSVHKIEFVNPLRREGLGKSLLGGGAHPMGGSRETLYCAWYDFTKQFDVILAASLRMVADLGDRDKVAAVIPGGVSGRTFDPHMKDQIRPFMQGDMVYWWFGDNAIQKNCRATLVLNPK